MLAWSGALACVIWVLVRQRGQLEGRGPRTDPLVRWCQGCPVPVRAQN